MSFNGVGLECRAPWTANFVDLAVAGVSWSVGGSWSAPILDLTRCTFINNRHSDGVNGGGIRDGAARLRGRVLRNNTLPLEVWGPVGAVNRVFVTGTPAFRS